MNALVLRGEKLIRDRIPEIAAAKGETMVTRIAERDEFRQALAEKLVEETAEFYRDRKLGELADVLEVVRTTAIEYGISLDQVVEWADRKRAERGGFEGRVILAQHLHGCDVLDAEGCMPDCPIDTRRRAAG